LAGAKITLDVTAKIGYNVSAMRQTKDAAYRQKRRHSLINMVGAFLLLVAGLLIVLLFYRNSKPLQDVYWMYVERLDELKAYVLNLRNLWLIVLAVLLLYCLKSLISAIPLWLMIVISGGVLQMHISFAVNITGMVILISIRYFLGRRLGGGQVQRLLEFNRDIRSFLEKNDSKSKPFLLFLFRTVPSFPLNPVSQLYGAMGFDYVDYVLISLLGFLPSLIIYTMIGKNAYDPLTFPFLIPLIIIFTLSGISIIGINMALKKIRNA